MDNNDYTYDELYVRILDAITTSEFSPGEKLNETSLSKELDVSRTPLRECLFQLASQGFLNYISNKGFSVPPLSKQELRECYPIIWSLEVEALEQSFRLLSTLAPKLNEINNTFKTTKRATSILRYDKEFHDVIADASDNETLKSILDNIKLRMRRYDVLFFSKTTLTLQSHKQHQQIVDAITNEDLASASKILKENWQLGLEYLLTQL